ncbi:hypothetical protein A0J61_05735 [Choanephora cucurbitarum]|uniref:F-box domain-containing protein n=1 Tax=Choanephora cucurbitarum TaxID=101091 RepID=A0A1C7NAS6_9FUNG|nr:hypothetical protein A0J61_05735 [Choanephora cucurbitarum]
MIARSILYNDVYVNCNSTDLRRLLNDLRGFRKLGPTISQLSLHGSKNIYTEAIWLEPIISHCPNLTVIQFEKDNATACLPFMSQAISQLGQLHQIQVTHLDQCSPITQCLYIELNYRFRHTLTQLELANIDTHDSLFSFERLIHFIKDFPCLKGFKASTSTKATLPTLSIDLPSLLLQCSLLESLSLSGAGMILKTHNAPLLIDTCFPLVSLELKQMHIGMDGLRWITHQLRKLETLSINDSMIMSSPWIDKQDEEEVMQQFLTYLIKTKHDYDLIHFRDWTYWIGVENKQLMSPVYKGHFIPSLLYENMDPEDPVFLTDRIRVL